MLSSGAPRPGGTVTISAGTLEVGNGAPFALSGTFNGPVVNNATLRINNGAGGLSVVLPSLGGTGTPVKDGSGTLELTGASTHSGALQLNAGTMVLNGSTAAAVTVGSGALLGGTGTINNTLTANAGAIIAPGNSIGTLTVNGALTFGVGSIYRVEANSAGGADRINVTGAPGTATVNGGTVDVQAGAGTYRASTQYTIINATGGVIGTFAGVTSNLAFLIPSLSYDANNVFLTLARSAPRVPGRGAHAPSARGGRYA